MSGEKPGRAVPESGSGTSTTNQRAATFVIGRLGQIEDVDDAACTLLGYRYPELVQLHGADVVPPDARPMTAATIDRMRRGEARGARGRLMRKDGTTLHVDVTARCLPQGQLVLTVRPLADDLPRPRHS